MKCPNCDGGYITPRGKDEALCGRCGAHFVTSVTQNDPPSAFEIQNPFLLPQLDFCGT